YEVEIVSHHDNTESFNVRRKGSSASARIIAKNGRCNCNDRVSFIIQCRHEIYLISGKFAKELFDKEQVTLSRRVRASDNEEIGLEKLRRGSR
ncbi:MAG: hypothetical protein ACREOZ_00305, partial [Gloeomargaritales cyanobacterium]